MKNLDQILAKLEIEQLSEMQLEVQSAFPKQKEILLLSPTGSGKTLAYLLPLMAALDPNLEQVQAIIVVPTRELAMQIEQVSRKTGTGFKTNAVYGGRAGAKDRMELKHPPTILIGTPGRLADHISRETLNFSSVKTLILDEYDKSLEIGFDAEMSFILESLSSVEAKLLTSATQSAEIPDFVGLSQLHTIDYLVEENSGLELSLIKSEAGKKLDTLISLIQQSREMNGIVFCNFKDSIAEISDTLDYHRIEHGTYHGDLEQYDRERALIQFRNGSHRVLLASDLAARGIDIPQLGYIIHYQVPHHADEFTHRNGRTARMSAEGKSYILVEADEQKPDYLSELKETNHQIDLKQTSKMSSAWTTIFISGGRKDKISKGDIAGLCYKTGGLVKDGLGLIEVKYDCSFVAVLQSEAEALIEKINNQRLKKKKVRVKLL